jgi:hypothetical protein
VWGGTFNPDDLPKPLPRGFSGEPAPHAKGKFAYVTMISPFVPWLTDQRKYSCMGLSLFSSIQKTNPNPNIEFVLAILLSDDDLRFYGKNLTESMIPEMLGQGVYEAYQQVGVDKFLIWQEMDTSRTIVSGSWKQAFSKLQMWTLVDYERIIFMDADKMVFHNLDHLFHLEGEFIAPGDWNCRNAGASLFPAGGFWVLRPSMKVFDVITRYLQGPDPCGEKWYQGDQIMPKLLFTDMSATSSPDNTLSAVAHHDPVSRWDGDVSMIIGGDLTRRISRCATYVSYGSHPTHRVDAVQPANGPSFIPEGSTWVMLNMSYDMTVGVCDDVAFIEKDNRFRIGAGGWDAVDPFSVHMSCFDGKPSCRRDPVFMQRVPQCLKEIFDRFYDNLKDFDMDKILAGIPDDIVAHHAGSSRRVEATKN